MLARFLAALIALPVFALAGAIPSRLVDQRVGRISFISSQRPTSWLFYHKQIGTYVLNEHVQNSTTFMLLDPTPPSNKFNMVTSESVPSIYPFVGLFITRSVPLSPNTTSCAIMTHTKLAHAGQTPQDLRNSYSNDYGLAESAVWTLNPETNEIQPYWVNEDSSSERLYPFVFESAGSAVAFTANMNGVIEQRRNQTVIIPGRLVFEPVEQQQSSGGTREAAMRHSA